MGGWPNISVEEQLYFWDLDVIWNVICYCKSTYRFTWHIYNHNTDAIPETVSQPVCIVDQTGNQCHSWDLNTTVRKCYMHWPDGVYYMSQSPLGAINLVVVWVRRFIKKMKRLHGSNAKVARWIGNVILTKFSSLAPPEVVKMPTSGAANDGNFIKMATSPSQCKLGLFAGALSLSTRCNQVPL